MLEVGKRYKDIYGQYLIVACDEYQDFIGFIVMIDSCIYYFNHRQLMAWFPKEVE